MEQKKVYRLNKDDNTAIQLFIKLGMSTNVAKTLIYISQVGECSSSDIEHGANMYQPGVSEALQELRKRGCVKRQNFKKKRRGRPVCVYKYMADLSEILKVFEQKKLQELESAKRDVSKLKSYIACR
ncbi:MAG: ArsR family transcriptional regulator [Thermoplasmatales archaeon]|nr:MAG: ArsR family transcriptional regulator [Thermoplasmatales archaeon]